MGCAVACTAGRWHHRERELVIWRDCAIAAKTMVAPRAIHTDDGVAVTHVRSWPTDFVTGRYAWDILTKMFDLPTLYVLNNLQGVVTLRDMTRCAGARACDVRVILRARLRFVYKLGHHACKAGKLCHCSKRLAPAPGGHIMLKNETSWQLQGP